MKNSIQIPLLFIALLYAGSSAWSQTVSTKRISMYGLALPQHQVTIRSSIESHIRAIHVREGDDVKQGDLLIELDGAAAVANRQVARLAAEETGPLLSAEAELEYATEWYQRVAKLHAQNAVNQREFQEASLRLKRAKAGYQIEKERTAGNRARLDLAEAELQKYMIRAPFDGTISRLSVDVGDSVTSNIDMLDVISIEQLRVEVFLPLNQADQLQVGQMRQLKIESPFEDHPPVSGRVVFRSSIIEATTETLRIVFEIDNRELGLPAGFTVSLLDDPQGRKPDGLKPNVREPNDGDQPHAGKALILETSTRQ